MGAKKIQDEAEVVRWFEEGRTYEWMSAEYQRKYNIEMTQSAWSNFRRRKGLNRRTVRDDNLIPWAVNPEHRHKYPLMMLRSEARRRAGREMKPLDQIQLANWLKYISGLNAVVHYDPDTVEGFFYVPREASDEDLIRQPERKTTERKAYDQFVPTAIQAQDRG
jgi:hypothetical protein